MALWRILERQHVERIDLLIRRAKCWQKRVIYRDLFPVANMGQLMQFLGPRDLIARVEFGGPRIACHRLWPVAFLLHCIAHIIMDYGNIWRQFQRFLETGNSILQSAQFLKGIAEVVMGLGKVGRMFDRSLIACSRGGAIATFTQRIAKVIMSICIVGLQFDCGCITFARGLRIAVVPIGYPQIVMGHGKV